MPDIKWTNLHTPDATNHINTEWQRFAFTPLEQSKSENELFWVREREANPPQMNMFPSSWIFWGSITAFVQTRKEKRTLKRPNRIRCIGLYIFAMFEKNKKTLSFFFNVLPLIMFFFVCSYNMHNFNFNWEAPCNGASTFKFKNRQFLTLLWFYLTALKQHSYVREPLVSFNSKLLTSLHLLFWLSCLCLICGHIIVLSLCFSVQDTKFCLFVCFKPIQTNCLVHLLHIINTRWNPH